MPEDHAHHHHPAPLIDQTEPPRPKVVRARHASSLILLRGPRDNPEMLMGMRGASARFNPNKLVFPGGSVDRADMSAPCATILSTRTEWALRKAANPHLTYALGIAAARELQEETGLSLGSPPRLDVLHYLMRAVTPVIRPIRFNARFFVADAHEVTGELGGDGELSNLRWYGVQEALEMDLAVPTRRVVEQLQIWLRMSDDEKATREHVPVLRNRNPRLWRE